MGQSESHVYRVNERDAKFEVLSESGRVILLCENEPSALGYAVLLNEAFQSGYKRGYRDGKNTRIRNT